MQPAWPTTAGPDWGRQFFYGGAMEIVITPSAVAALTIASNLRAYAINDETSVVLAEVVNTTDQLVEGALAQAVGYDVEGGMVALAEAGPFVLFPKQRRPVWLTLRAFVGAITCIRILATCDFALDS